MKENDSFSILNYRQVWTINIFIIILVYEVQNLSIWVLSYPIRKNRYVQIKYPNENITGDNSKNITQTKKSLY